MPSFKFRVLLDTDGSEEIFRDIVISTNENFELFYRAIITAFEFTGQELASFYVSNDSWEKGQSFEPEVTLYFHVPNNRAIKLSFSSSAQL